MTGAARKWVDPSWTESRTDRQAAGAPAWNHRVLIVEDEVSVADAYKDILGAAAQKVVPLRRSSRTATHGSAAMKVEAESQPSPSEAGGVMQFELTIVNSADQALAEVKHAMANNRPFTMGFFDVLLGGGMDGIELVKKLLEIDPHLHAVFVTAYSDRSVDSIQTFLGEEKAGQWDYLTKPFTQGEILQKARAGVTLWNLKREREEQEDHLEVLQKQVRESERLASAAVVARGLSHEFRNILTLIAGHAELGAAKTDIVQLKQALETILKASGRAEEILDRFKFLSVPSAKAHEKKKLFLHQPIEEAILLLNHQLKTHNVRVCWIRKNKVELNLNATAIVQVFVNLTMNAIHAMGTSGQIDLSIAELGNRVEVRFRDYGPGIDASILPRVTEAFFTTKGDKGTGLGLAIAKEIIEMEHLGEFKIANHEIKGLEVTMVFPLDGGGILSDG